ncbi:MAG: DUF4391 domain-containing protein [Erysipelotrichaceae bacterium]
MEWIKNLQIPLCKSQRIPIKTLIEQLDITSSDKRLVEKHLAVIKLVSILDETTIRIRAYKDENYSYQSIYVLFIELKTDTSIVTLSNIVHSAFPEPTLLIYRLKSSYYISTSSKRINKVDTEKSVIEEVTLEKINPNINKSYLSIKELTGSNLKEYYENIVSWVYKLKLFQITNIYPSGEVDFKAIIKDYDKLTQDIDKLKERYKTASMLAEKMRIDDEIYDKEKLQKIMKSNLKGDQVNG